MGSKTWIRSPTEVRAFIFPITYRRRNTYLLILRGKETFAAGIKRTEREAENFICYQITMQSTSRLRRSSQNRSVSSLVSAKGQNAGNVSWFSKSKQMPFL